MKRRISRKKVILFDLDRTLIDTDAFSRDRRKLFERFGIGREDADRAIVIKMNGKTLVDPVAALSLIKDPAKRRDAKILLRKKYEDAEKYNYEGIRDFISSLHRDYSLILLSYGHQPFQLLKFRQTGLARFFSRTIITTNEHKRKDLVSFKKKYGENVLIVDDSLSVARAARAVGMKIIWVRRGRKDAVYFSKLLKRIRVAFP